MDKSGNAAFMNETILEAFLLIIIGMISRLVGFVGDEDSRIFSKLVFNITLPFLVFLAMFHQHPSIVYFKITIAVWILLLLFTGVIYYITGRLIKDKKRRAVFILTSVGGNTAFLGYAVIHSLAGDKGMPVAVVYDQLGSSIFIYTVIVLLLSHITNRSISFKGMVKNVFTPPLTALFIGLVFPSSIRLPGFIMDAFNMIANITTPLMMLVVGMNLTKPVRLHTLPFLSCASIIKLAVMPGVMYLLAIIMSIPNFPMKIMVLQSAMPAMMTSVVFAHVYDLDESLAAQIVFGSTFISFFSLQFIWKMLA